MFGIGFSEILIIALAIIVFVRPGDLPKFLRALGRLYGKARRAYKELSAVKDRFIQELDEAAGDEFPSKPVIPPPDPAAESRPDSTESP